MAFTAGFNFIVLEHPAAPLDLWHVEDLYDAYAELAAKTNVQQSRVDYDKKRIHSLPVDASYYVVLRNRVGPHQETKRVSILRDFGVFGLFTPVYTSRVILWDLAGFESARDMIHDLQKQFIDVGEKGVMPQGQEQCRVL